MPDAAWKRHEREVANLLGGSRLPRPRSTWSSVDAAPATPNVEFGRWHLQVRTVPRFPRWMAGGLNLVRRHSCGGRRGALVLVRSSQGVPTERWAVLPFDEYRALLERAGDLDELAPVAQTVPPSHTPILANLGQQNDPVLERWFGPDPLRGA